MNGLGYLPALCVPHHDVIQSNGVPRSKDSEEMLFKFPNQPSIGIDENAAFIVANGHARTISADGKADCVVKRVILAKDGSQVMKRTPFTPSHGSIPVDVLWNGNFGQHID